MHIGNANPVIQRRSRRRHRPALTGLAAVAAVSRAVVGGASAAPDGDRPQVQPRSTAVDNAGNRTVSEIGFGTTTSLRDIGQLLDRFQASSQLSAAEYKDLSKHLAKAREAEARGLDPMARRDLASFIRLADEATDQGVRAVLVRDAEEVQSTLSESVRSRPGAR